MFIHRERRQTYLTLKMKKALVSFFWDKSIWKIRNIRWDEIHQGHISLDRRSLTCYSTLTTKYRWSERLCTIMPCNIRKNRSFFLLDIVQRKINKYEYGFFIYHVEYETHRINFQSYGKLSMYFSVRHLFNRSNRSPSMLHMHICQLILIVFGISMKDWLWRRRKWFNYDLIVHKE